MPLEIAVVEVAVDVAIAEPIDHLFGIGQALAIPLEVFVPATTSCEFKVAPGDKVAAGETIIGVLGK